VSANNPVAYVDRELHDGVVKELTDRIERLNARIALLTKYVDWDELEEEQKWEWEKCTKS
jgi:hypothetical protein